MKRSAACARSIGTSRVRVVAIIPPPRRIRRASRREREWPSPVLPPVRQGSSSLAIRLTQGRSRPASMTSRPNSVEFSIDLRVTCNDRILGKIDDGAGLGSLELKIDAQELLAEPGAGGFGGGKPCEGIVEGLRQLAEPCLLARAVRHVPDAFGRRRREGEASANAVDTGMKDGA